MEAVGIIPARLRSSRLPRKLLLDATGKPLLQHTWEAAHGSGSLTEVIVATDSDEIADAVRRFGGRCVMTGEQASGTDRVAEVVRQIDLQAKIIVNIQGDEPEIDPVHIDRVVCTLDGHPGAEMATLATPITSAAERDDFSCTKVVRAGDGRALYFSRLPIPACRDADPDDLLQTGSPWLLHVGLYAYRREFLLTLAALPPSPLERLEKLEQLRALEAGASILVETVDQPSVGIDTPEDYARFVKRHREQTVCPPR